MPHKIPFLLWHGFVKDSLRIFKFLPRRLKLSYFFVFFFQIITAITETFTLLVISLFAMSVASYESAMNHFMIRPFFEFFTVISENITTPRRMVAFTSCFMISFVIIKSILTIYTNHVTTIFSEKVAYHVGREAIRRYLNKGYYWHISSESSDIMHKIINRSSLSQFTILLLQLYSNIICCVFLFTSLFIAQPRLTVVVVLSFSLTSILLYTSIRHSLDRAGQISSSTSIEESITMTAMTKGIREIITFRQQKIALKKMMAAVERGLPARAYLAFCHTMPGLIMECVGFSTIGGMVIYMLAAHEPMDQIVSAASILMLTAWRILPTVTRSLTITVNLRGIKTRALISLDLLENFTRQEVDVVSEPDPKFRFTTNLEMRGVDFRYPNSKTLALKNINAKIKKGQSVGLIGPSGAGKTTLALLLSGLVPPTGGSFFVDGRELNPATRAAYLSKLGYVPQNPLLMQGTLADNVAFSRWGLGYEREQVLEACKLAAMDFVMSDPKILDMNLGGGGSLSGGQSQRVAIARALFISPEVIIFDEATSSLDQANENIIRNTITRIRGEITIIIIAHRLTTVEDCDLIFWIENGSIKMIGSPAEVLPIYADSVSKPVTQPSLSIETLH
jgi:ABC-type multidrug transport system fused ATPase/permease subunit